MFTLKGQQCEYRECLIFTLKLQHKIDYFYKIHSLVLYQGALSIESRYSGIPIVAIGLRIDFRKTGLTSTKLSTAGKPATGEPTAITQAPEETREATAKTTIVTGNPVEVGGHQQCRNIGKTRVDSINKV
jgi:hypothetical protein